jgi:FkbM family methyltransferase
VIRDKADASKVVIVAPTRYGRMMVLSNDRYMGAAFTTFGEYSESEVALWRQLIPDGAICVDAGANIGAHTVALAALVPNGLVVAFEPLRFMYHMLAGNVALNALTNVMTYHAALGATPGVIYVPGFDYTADNNYGGIALGGFAQGNPVPQITLDSVGLPRLDFLKADVEGMEQAVLEGAATLIAMHRPCLYLENNPGDKQQALIDYVHGLDYDIWWHRAPLFNPDNFAGVTTTDDHTLHVVSHNILCLPREGQHDIQGLDFILRPESVA